MAIDSETDKNHPTFQYLRAAYAALCDEKSLHCIHGQNAFPCYGEAGGMPTHVSVLIEKRWPIGTPIETILADINGG